MTKLFFAVLSTCVYFVILANYDVFPWPNGHALLGVASAVLLPVSILILQEGRDRSIAETMWIRSCAIAPVLLVSVGVFLLAHSLHDIERADWWGSALGWSVALPDHVRIVRDASVGEWSHGLTILSYAAYSFGEEVFFRRYLVATIVLPRVIQTIVISILFAVFHSTVQGFVAHFVSGVTFTLVIMRSRSLVAAWLVHFVSNLLFLYFFSVSGLYRHQYLVGVVGAMAIAAGLSMIRPAERSGSSET